ncbi:TetR family transcriptional regulator C-terminal domain-containing protein [Pseudomonas sp. UFMG81]|uniref:TetR family transcriptional regulator C-terminal domain-containing protein n=1 Tax=Pseudomonas sp. UFMG81 TaxID=2745936 RepID=UPI00188E2BB1|nr:TetR family transcriptional regulator C-terminal domain-containing protein [Pseudomonas sp. UFMG81]
MPTIRDRNQQLILDAASEAFAHHGYAAARMDDIAARAGLPRPNVFYYFRNKRLLYAAVLDLVMEPLLHAANSLNAAIAPDQALPRYLQANAEVARRHPHAARIWLKELLHGARQLSPRRNEDLRVSARQSLACLSAWMDRGLIARTDPEHLLLFLWSTPLALFRFGEAPGSASQLKPTRASSQALADMLLRGLRPECERSKTAVSLYTKSNSDAASTRHTATPT